MNIFAQSKVFDAFMRQAVFIEQVKLAETQKFNETLREIEEVFRRHMSQIKYETLDGLSKAQLKAFLNALRKSQSIVYSRYQKELIVRLNDLMKATVNQTAVIGGTLRNEEREGKFKLLSLSESLREIEAAVKEDNTTPLFGLLAISGTAAGFSHLWSKITSAPLPSGGALPFTYINTAIASAMVNLENIVSNGYANKLTKQDVMNQALGSPAGGAALSIAAALTVGGVVAGVAPVRPAGPSSVLRKTSSAMSAVVATVAQHFTQNSIGAAASAFAGGYVWVSVMDSHTTEICKSRNRKRYIYGKGPLPPAHTRCRSHVVPAMASGEPFEVESFHEWLKTQPKPFIRDVFGSTIADKFEAGKTKSSDFVKFAPTKAKTAKDLTDRTPDLF